MLYRECFGADLGSLADYEPNKIVLDKNNVCRVLVQVLQKHVSGDGLLQAVGSVFKKDTSSAGVAQWGCTAIYYIAKVNAAAARKRNSSLLWCCFIALRILDPR
jgi:hypothetical protein